MYCKYCGAEIEDDSIFCTTCGKRLVSQNPEPPKLSPINILIKESSPTSPDPIITSPPVSTPVHYEENHDEVIQEEVVFGLGDTTQTEKKSYGYVYVLVIIAAVILGIVFSGAFAAITSSPDEPVVTPKQGTVYITSYPSGATVKFGGSYKGVTPLELTITPNTDYALYITKDGYNMWYQSVSVYPGEYRTISATLSPRYTQPTYTPQPTYIPQPTYTPTPTTSPNDYYARHYEWEYDGNSYYLDMQLPKATYSYYKSLGHSNTNLAKYATDVTNRKTAKSVADAIKEYGSKHNLHKFEEVMMAVTFVQSLPYTSDDVTTGHDEYVRYPIETLVDNGGDCEDTAILTAAILREMGYGVVLLDFPGHVAVGVKGGDGIYGTYWNYNGEKYYYLETTGENWDIGEIPDSHKNQKAVVIYVA